jgi:hypothetical protein
MQNPAAHLRWIAGCATGRALGGLLLLAGAGALRAAPPAATQFRGGKVEWARLKTDSPHWDQHSERDSHVIALMRTETSLNMDDAWHAASVGQLEELCAYPFLFAETIATVSDAEARNLAEYLRRGGFLLIDACVRVTVNPDADAFLADQTAILRRQFPQLRVAALEPGHEIFSIYFKLEHFPPQTHSGTNPSWAHRSTEPLRGLFLGERMIGLISLSGFQCGLVQNPNPSEVIRMVTNIYLYAMTR